jgi:hypothetical protein
MKYLLEQGEFDKIRFSLSAIENSLNDNLGVIKKIRNEIEWQIRYMRKILKIQFDVDIENDKKNDSFPPSPPPIRKG